MNFTLIIGNRNYSSWSLRAWLVARFSGKSFEIKRILLDTPEFGKEILAFSPSAMVPALREGDWVINDSLAIAEYLNDCAPQAQLWPADLHERARARSMSCEMHSGFAALRNEMPMNIRATNRRIKPSEATQKDIKRIVELWQECLTRSESERGGPWLFGRFSICDAMFVPVAFRFRTYSVELPAECRAYVEHCYTDPLVQEWISLALAEKEILHTEEVGV